MGKKPKIGEGHASAMGRQGLRELRGAMYPESNVAQQPEYGLYGTRTPGEVQDERWGKDNQMDSRGDSIGQDRLQQPGREADVYGNRGDDRGMSQEFPADSVVGAQMREIEREGDIYGDRGEDREMDMDR